MLPYFFRYFFQNTFSGIALNLVNIYWFNTGPKPKVTYRIRYRQFFANNKIKIIKLICNLIIFNFNIRGRLKRMDKREFFANNKIKITKPRLVGLGLRHFGDNKTRNILEI